MIKDSGRLLEVRFGAMANGAQSIIQRRRLVVLAQKYWSTQSKLIVSSGCCVIVGRVMVDTKIVKE